MNGSNAPRDENDHELADVPRERRRFLAHLHRDFRPLAHSRSKPFTSRPDRVPARRSLGPGGNRRVPQPRDERLITQRLAQMFVLRWRHLWKMLFVTRRWLRPSAPRLRPFSPAPAPVPLKSSQIVLARWYVLTRRPPRQSNAANRLFRSATHPVATSTKRYIDVHNAVNCTAAKKAQKLHPS